MSKNFKLEGIYTPLATPYDKRGALRFEALAELIESLVDAGVHGLISGGSTGEYYSQTLEERLELASFTKDRLKGRLPLIVGTGALRTADSVAMAKGARKLGAEAILVGSPPYSVPTEEENALNALRIDKAVGLPLVLYNYPDRMGVNMGETFLKRVIRSPNVCGIKESSGDINRLHLLANDFPKIQFSCGMDDQALEFFAWGARSWICAGSNFLPKEHLALYRACALEGDFNKGRRIMSAMMPLMRVLEQGRKFIQNVKHGMEIAGLTAGPPRPPLKALNKREKQQLEKVVRATKAAIAKIEAGK